MDLQRIMILLGLAAVSYMLVLRWNEDYGQSSEAVPVAEAPSAVPAGQTPQLETSAEDGLIPELESLTPASAPRTEIPEAEQERSLIQVSTDVFRLQIDPVGGNIVQVALPQYPATLDTPDIPFVLIGPRNDYVGQSGLIGPNGTDRQGERPLFIPEQTEYDQGDASEMTVTLRHFQENGTEIVKTFSFRRGDYLIDVNHEVINRSQEVWRGGLFVQIRRNDQEPVSASNNLIGMQPYVGGATRSDEELYRKIEFDDLEDESYKLTRAGGYMAMVQHYFVSAWVPVGEAEVNYYARKLHKRDIYLFGYTTQGDSIAAGETRSLAAQLYVGPKDQYRLREISEGLDLTVDYGFLWWLAQPLFYLLTQIHGLVANWGVAIIGLTMIVKLLLYPLSAASFRSMAKMRKLQPEMVRLKERHGNDRQAFSQAMMGLYKKEGANPLGGCFPILLQMPVFLALYWTLMESVELRQAPFFLWIDDLSAMDPLFILPILMGISMYLMQRMQPEPPDPLQARVFKLMPILFTFFFLWFPSGLVLYWLVNNLLSILQQWYVMHRMEKST